MLQIQLLTTTAPTAISDQHEFSTSWRLHELDELAFALTKTIDCVSLTARNLLGRR